LSSQNPTNIEEKNSAAFMKVLDQQESEGQTLRKGHLVSGKIVAVQEQTVYVNIGQKSDGKVALSEFSEPPKIGDTVDVVFKSKEHDEYSLSKREADLRKGWDFLKEAHEKNVQIQGRIESEVKKKGYTVKMLIDGDITLFLPASQLVTKKGKLEELKSKTLDFKILKLFEKKRSGIISQRVLFDEINKEKWNEILQKYHVGDKVTGTVSKIASFGVFCNVDGIEGLLRQNDISYKKYAPFKQYFAVGQEVELQIIEMDPENNRLGLGIKQMFEDPWVWAERELEKDMVVRGVVTSLTNFGAFVELKEGLEGLIHSSELTWAKKPPHPKDILKKGQEVDSIVLDINTQEKRLSLGLKQLAQNPWDNLGSNVYVGSVLEGKITGITKYGAFVEVEPGIEGLIHVGDITWDEKDKDPTSSLKKGQVVKYQILDVNIEGNRISCGIKQLLENPYELLRKKYPPGSIIEGKIKSVVDFGLFVEVEPGFEGLVHTSQLPPERLDTFREDYQVGEITKAVILKIESKTKKISLSIKDFAKALEREEMSKYIKNDAPSSESMGSFFNSSNLKSS
jgi:small subunit ribosomal protein S1